MDFSPTGDLAEHLGWERHINNPREVYQCLSIYSHCSRALLKINNTHVSGGSHASRTWKLCPAYVPCTNILDTVLGYYQWSQNATHYSSLPEWHKAHSYRLPNPDGQHYNHSHTSMHGIRQEEAYRGDRWHHWYIQHLGALTLATAPWSEH